MYILDKHCDIVLVGVSMANVLYDHKNTHMITLNNIIQHTMSVKGGIKILYWLLICQKELIKIQKLQKNAKLVMKLTKCDAIKMSNNKNFKIIRELIREKIPVMGHIGYTPQFKKKFKIEGVSQKEAGKLLKEAKNEKKLVPFQLFWNVLHQTQLN